MRANRVKVKFCEQLKILMDHSSPLLAEARPSWMATKYIPQKSTKAERSTTNKKSNLEQLQVPCKTADVSWIRWKLELCLNIACQRDEHAQDVSMKKKTLFARLQLKETRFISLRSKWLTYVLANDSTGHWDLQRIFKCTRVSNSRPVKLFDRHFV